MAYNKQNFIDGQKLIAAKLNHIEEGISDVEGKADSAAAAAQSAGAEAAEAGQAAEILRNDMDAMQLLVSGKVDGAYVENGYLYLTSNDEIVAGPLGPFGSGTGGGSGSNNAVLTLSNTSGWLSKTIALGADCEIQATWSSIEDGIATGNGVVAVRVNGSVKMQREYKQGELVINVGSYLEAGSNAVKLTVTDVYGNARTINYSIAAVQVSITSAFDASAPFDGAIQFIYTPVGNVDKTVHFILDGNEIGTAVVAVSGRQQTYNIPAQSHGAHALRVYFDAVIDEETVTSNELYFELICIEEGKTAPVIVSTFRGTEIAQYGTVQIEYRVYDPVNLTAAIDLKANGESFQQLTVDRTMQTWAYRADDIGALELAIVCGNVSKEFSLTVVESDIQIEAEEQNLALYLSSYGRSNSAADRDIWQYGDISASFSGFNWVSDGWQLDEHGGYVLRVTGDARVNVPVMIFQNDFRTTGKTIEIEFASKDVLDYDAMILSSMSDGRGIQITAQRADMSSEQSEIGTQYKEDEHVRLTFVTEKRSGNRLILIYLNGIISGIKQYPADDDFTQGTPVGLSIGSNDCTIDIYNIRVYDNDLTRYQVLDNWVADTQEIGERLERYRRNLVYDDYGKVVKERLPQNLPYLVLEGAALPTDKGDKKTVSGYYVDPQDAKKSFVFTGAEIDVQGTSSKDYYVKNFKVKFKNGFEISGVMADVYKLRENSIGTNVFTFKADVASSEGANNVELVRLYNDISPHKTPPQAANPLVRQGIDGLPIVIFWDNGSTIAFQGKYNFNNDKATAEVFGFAAGDESWEIKNNVSNRVMFKSADFSDNSAETGWQNDFEARYPEDNMDPSNLAAFAAWVVSTDRDAATGSPLGAAVEYDGVSYTVDSAEYRLAKFRNELAQRADVSSAMFYWLFTEFFLMVDSRAKNAFPTRFHGDGKWCWLPYDMDTAIGINNEGALAFDYALEDTDVTESGAQVFNGQQSVFWRNVRDAFADEIKQMYIDLRTDGKLTYEDVMNRFDTHQAIWPEAIMNEDAYRKYIEPYEVEGATIYFAMAQGKKELQRTWWLYNRFRYMDAKYDAGDIASDRILIRIYADADIAITPYADTYLRSKYGSYAYQVRAKRGQEYLLHCYVDAANDLETTLYPASLIAEIADLSGLKIGLADFSKAVKLQVLKIGDGATDYSNGNLTELTLGNNRLLRHLDVRNCPNLKQAVDVSGCTNIEEIYFEGSAITGLSLPNGGVLKTLHLPGTIANLTILNQKAISDFVLPSYSQITTLRLENVADTIDTAAILAGIPANSRVRLIGIDWTFEDADDILALYDHLDTMRGMDEAGNTLDTAQVSGTLHIDNLTGSQLAEMQSRYPYITIDYQNIVSYCYFYNDDGSTLLYTAECVDGADAVYGGSTPSKTSTAQYTYSFAGWATTPGGSADANALNDVTIDRNLYAAFTATIRTYTVYFYNGSTLLQTVSNVPYGGSATYTGATPTYTGDNAEDYEYIGFNPTGKSITGNTSCYAQFRYTGYVYPQLIDGSVTEYEDDTLTSVDEYAFYKCASLTKVDLAAATEIGNYAFSGCSALTMLILRNTAQACTLGSGVFTSTPIASGTGYVYVPAALVDTYKAAANWSTYAGQIRAIEDYVEAWAKNSWDMVNYRIQQGDYASYYAIGDLIPLDLGTEGQINMQIAGFDVDDLADGTGKAHISFVAKELLNTTHRMNPALVTNDDGTYQEGTGGIGGWGSSEMRTYLNDTILPLIPEDVRSMIMTVTKYADSYDTSGTAVDSEATEDGVWIPSYREIYGAMNSYEMTGPMYTGLFSSNTFRIKRKVGVTYADIWSIRSANSTNGFRRVGSTGSPNTSGSSSAFYVALGFCV